MKRKLFAILMSTAMVAAMAGCGSSSASSAASSASSASSAASSSSTAEASASETSSASSASSESSESASSSSAETVSADSSAASGDVGDPVELVFTSVSVTGDSHTTAMQAFADKVNELSGGNVTCKTYSDGTLFAADAEWDALVSDQADIAYISFPTLATQEGLEWCSMFGTAYFWNSYDHMTSVLNGDIGKNEIFPAIDSRLSKRRLTPYRFPLSISAFVSSTPETKRSTPTPI